MAKKRPTNQMKESNRTTPGGVVSQVRGRSLPKNYYEGTMVVLDPPEPIRKRAGKAR
jgi:hypothetical protein